MNVEELQDWLLDEGIQIDLQRVSQLSALYELDSFEPSIDTKSMGMNIEWDRLLLAGSILARSKERRHEEAALRIATGALIISKDMPTKDAAAVILGKLANHRTIELGEARELINPSLEERLGVTLRIEAQRRRLDASILVHSTGEQLLANGFQQDFWAKANNPGAWLSASAPTASGKTFLVLKWLVDTIESGLARIAIYLAPTRALVSEVESNLSEAVGDNPNVEVTSLPLPDKYLAAIASGNKTVFVLTQERVHILANSLEKDIVVDLLVVDEAHKIGDSQRGVVLQDAVERLSRANPNMRAVFVSPATENPEVLLEDVPKGVSPSAISSDSPTILQNVIYADQVPRRPKEWALKLRIDRGEPIELGVLNLQNKPQGLRKRVAFIAAAVGQRGGTLVYVNGAAEAEKIALLMSQVVEEQIDPDPELTDLAQLIRNCVHSKFQLANVVEKGVGFHYGNMPSLIRLEVERLFRHGKLKFLVCTSTLIEGVNLSCRTIVVRGPKKGQSTPMEPHDFWNLAGRAGRWGNEFQGNIVCINPSDLKVWPVGVPKRAKFPIKRETDVVLRQAEDICDYLSSLDGESEQFSGDIAKLDQVSSYLLCTFMRLGSITEADFAKRHNAQDVQAIDAQLESLARNIEVPVEVVVKHPGVNAVGLQRLLEFFQSYDGDIEDVLPASAESVDAYERFSEIMKRINQCVFPVFLPEKLIPLHALIVLEWLRGYSLAAIIRKRINYHEKHWQSYDIAKVIRDTMELIEQTARFKAPKYFAAYLDVAKLHLVDINREDLIEEDLDIGIALEFGVSTKTLLSLMEFGLSRISAVALYEKIARDDFDREECIQWVKERSEHLDALGLPRLVLREIRNKILSENIDDASME